MSTYNANIVESSTNIPKYLLQQLGKSHKIWNYILLSCSIRNIQISFDPNIEIELFIFYSLSNSIKTFKTTGKKFINHHDIIISLDLLSLCFSLVVNTILCQYNLKLDSRTSLSSVFCSFLFLLKSRVFSCCLAFHCSTRAFSFFNYFTIPCSSLILSFFFSNFNLKLWIFLYRCR